MIVGDSVAEDIAVGRGKDWALDTVVYDHVDSGLGGDRVHVDCAVLDGNHVLLAVVLCNTSLVVVVEEAVHACGIHKYIATVLDDQTPCIFASNTICAGTIGAVCKVWVVIL